MKVDFIIGRLGKGGAERVIVTISAYFVEMGHQVRLITFDDSEDGYPIDEKIGRIRLTKKKIPIVKIQKALNLTRFYDLEQERPDVAISFLTATNLIAIISCKLKNIPIIVSEHNNHLFVPNPKWLIQLSWRYLYRQANFVTVLTAFDVPFFKKRKSNVVVMPNPCPFAPIKENTHERKKEILAVGSINRIQHKGFDNLIEIVSEVLPQQPDWRLSIVGGGKEENFKLLKQLVAKYKLENQVLFLGFSNQVTELMKSASIYILPSRFEGLPMVLLEAMSQGMACIAYDCVTGPAEIIEHEKNGILVNDQDMAKMQEELLLLMKNEELQKKYGDAGMQSLDKYTIENIYKKWDVLLQQIQA